MRILFVVPYVPTLIRTRSYNLMRALSARGNQITLLTLWSSEQEKESAERLKADFELVYSFPLPVWRSLSNSLRALPTSQPLQAWYCWQPELAKKLLSLAQHPEDGKKYDVVHVEHLRGVKYALHLRSKLGKNLPVVWDSVDSIALLFRQSSAQSAKLFYRWLTQFELRRTERMEAQMLERFDRILVTSQKDREAFLSYAGLGKPVANVTVLPNGVDLEYFHPERGVQREEDNIVVSGKMSYHANITMVMYLFEKIMPVVWSRRPQAKLWVVGKDPSSEIQALGNHPNVVVTGTVEDIRPYLQKATLAVAPLVYGAGSQFKVIESMACGTPVAANPLAVAAFQAVPEREVLVAHEPDQFAENVIRLLEDPDLRIKIGTAGRLYVERCHDWNKIAVQLEEVYHGVN